jgi:membrane-bound metal-dependent hydrolase YbcI (DUF457 family)
MALSIAHAAAGYLVYEATRPMGPHRPGLLLGAAVLANGPDFDFLPGLIVGNPDLCHRGVTHTLGATLLVTAVAAAAAWVVRRRWSAVRAVAVFVGAAYGSHLLLDFCTADAVPPHGAQFLWPFSTEYYLLPKPLLGELIIDRTGRAAFLASLVSRAALVRWGTEMLLLVGAVVGVHAVRALRTALAATEAPLGEES